MAERASTEPFVSKFVAQHFGCLKNVTANLSPLHAFIGPNDSGKSTLLRAMECLIQIASGEKLHSDPSPYIAGPTTLQASFHDDGTYEVQYHGQQWKAKYNGAEESPNRLGLPYSSFSRRDPRVARWLRGSRIVILDPRELRTPSTPIQAGQEASFFVNRGRGLPGICDLILGRGDDSFLNIVGRIKETYQTVRRVGLKPIANYEKEIEVELHDGTRVPAGQVSDGLLYSLAFSLLQFLQPVAVLLVEEPENGLHPALLQDVVKTLRGISESGTQVIMATHSPLVINELKPSEVSIVTRTLEEGTRLASMAGVPDIERKLKSYALGELWVSFANGKDEAPLLEGPAPIGNSAG